MVQFLSGEDVRRGTDTIVLGVAAEKRVIGFGSPRPTSSLVSEQFIAYDGDAHLCTVAPTRSGKGRGVIIPNLLSYTGPVIVCDMKGENYQVTARRRRELGHQVVKLDPFSVIDDQSDSLNPLDLFQLMGSDLECDAQSLAEMLARGIKGMKEPFWDINGCGFTSGLLAYAATQGEDAKRHIMTVVERLTADDIVYNLAVVLDTIGKNIAPMARQEIASVLQMPDITRGGVIATAQTYFKPFANEKVGRCLRTSTFRLKDVVLGKPLSIYIIIPPNRMHSHRGLLKLFFGTLLAALLSRRQCPEQKTLVILDEAAQLESFPLLETMLTLSAGYGVRVHSFWQDLSQLVTHYPTSWKTILNNSAVLQTFGIYNRDMAMQWGHYLQHGPGELRSLHADEQILSIHGHEELRCQRLDYLKMRCYAGLADGNGFYRSGRCAGLGQEPAVRREVRVPQKICITK